MSSIKPHHHHNVIPVSLWSRKTLSKSHSVSGEVGERGGKGDGVEGAFRTASVKPNSRHV